jgi:hypothetical protein
MESVNQSLVNQEQNDIRQAEENSIGPDKISIDKESEKAWLAQPSINDDSSTLALWKGHVLPKSSFFHDAPHDGNCVWDCLLLILRICFPGRYNHFTVKSLKDVMCTWMRENLGTVFIPSTREGEVEFNLQVMIIFGHGDITKYLE